MAACLRFTRRVWQSFVTNKGHDAQCFPNLVINHAMPGSVDVSLKVEQYHIHGGLILSLTDTVGSLAIASKGYFMTGVSTNIGSSFVRPAGNVGDVLYAKAVVTAIGKQLAYTRVDFTNASGELRDASFIVDHTKYIGKSSSHPENIKLSDDGSTEVGGGSKETH